MGDLTYRYSSAAILQGIEAIKKTHNNIDTRLDELEAYALGQMSAWDGPTRDLYTEYKANWDGHINKMKDIMVNGAIPSLQRILDNYDNTERINSAGWQDG